MCISQKCQQIELKWSYSPEGGGKLLSEPVERKGPKKPIREIQLRFPKKKVSLSLSLSFSLALSLFLFFFLSFSRSLALFFSLPLSFARALSFLLLSPSLSHTHRYCMMYGPQGDEQQVVIFFGLIAMVVNLLGSSVSDWLIQTGLIGD